MDNLIKYRNDRKNEGASAADLKLIDERITTLLRPEKPKWICEFVPLGQATVKVVGVGGASAHDVVVDLETETVGNLVAKACKVHGIGEVGVKIVSGGKHLDAASSLKSTWIRDGSHVAICSRLGCDGHCDAATLCQPAFARGDRQSPDLTAVRALLRAMKGPPTRSATAESLACWAVDPRDEVAPTGLWASLRAATASASAATAAPLAQPVPSDEDLYS